MNETFNEHYIITILFLTSPPRGALTNIGLHKIQPISPSHLYDSEFNIHGKIQNILLYNLF